MSERDTLIEDPTLTDALTAAEGALGPWVRAQRWSGAQDRCLEGTAIGDSVSLDPGPPALVLALVDVQFADAPAPHRYAVPLLARVGGEGEGAVARVLVPGAAEVSLDDATDAEALPRALLELVVADAQRQTAQGGLLAGRTTQAMKSLLGDAAVGAMAVRRFAGEQSNTSYVLGQRLVLKLLRRLHPGVHPDVEATEFLTHLGFPHAPRLAGVLTHRAQGSFEETVVAMVQEFVPSPGDAWSITLSALRDGLAHDRDLLPLAAPLRRLGEVTGSLHAVLASDATSPAFKPQPLSHDDHVALLDGIARRLDEIEDACARLGDGWSSELRREVEDTVRRARAGREQARAALEALPAELSKIRVHGDYHLGQVLATDEDFVILDFEGEPLRPLSERRARSSPLRDVAGMLRSFAYAAKLVAREHERDPVRAKLAAWERAAREAFLEGYLAHAQLAAVPIVPADPAVRARALAVYELDKALYEVMYEIGHRPAWVSIPLAGVQRAMEAIGA